MYFLIKRDYTINSFNWIFVHIIQIQLILIGSILFFEINASILSNSKKVYSTKFLYLTLPIKNQKYIAGIKLNILPEVSIKLPSINFS